MALLADVCHGSVCVLLSSITIICRLACATAQRLLRSVIRSWPFLADILISWVLIWGCVLCKGLQIFFTLWQKSKVVMRIIFDGVLCSKFYGIISPWLAAPISLLSFSYNRPTVWWWVKIVNYTTLFSNSTEVLTCTWEPGGGVKYPGRQTDRHQTPCHHKMKQFLLLVKHCVRAGLHHTNNTISESVM